MTEPTTVTVIGAGILGLWQALTLARAGHRVTLIEASGGADPFAATASRYAGAMLAPDCEGEAAPEIVRQHGHAGLKLWRQVYPHLVEAGTLVLAQPRDRSEITRFARMTGGHTELDADAVGRLEPDLKGRFASGLYFADEAHMETPAAMHFLLDAARAAEVNVRLGAMASATELAEAASLTLSAGAVREGRATTGAGFSALPAGAAREGRATTGALVVDCRGLGARGDIAGLRGVRGERVVVRARDVTLARPVRLLHPRHPLYVVPWPEHVFMIGATVIESEDDGPATVRSALELMGIAYALHPGFGEAEILEFGAGLRPAYADNVPRVTREQGGRVLRVNGAYRHGFLLAPVLAEVVASVLRDPAFTHPLLIDEAAT